MFSKNRKVPPAVRTDNCRQAEFLKHGKQECHSTTMDVRAFAYDIYCIGSFCFYMPCSCLFEWNWISDFLVIHTVCVQKLHIAGKNDRCSA